MPIQLRHRGEYLYLYKALFDGLYFIGKKNFTFNNSNLVKKIT